MKMRTRSKARRSFVIPDPNICSDIEDDEPCPRQRKRNHAIATMPRAGGTSKISAATRINSPVLLARHLQLVNHEPATRDASDQVQECASEEADSNLTTTLNFFFRVTNFSSPFCECRRAQNPQDPKGLWMASKGSQHNSRKDKYGRNCNPHFMFRRGCV